MATEALVLAAGAGARFGGGKLLAPRNGQPLLHGALAAALAAPVRRVTVVSGAEAAAVEAVVHSFDPRLTLVHAADHAEGMAASLRTGVGSLAGDVDAAFIFLGDMPSVSHAVLQPLADAVSAGAPAAAPVFDGRRGNPVILTRALFPQLLALTGDVGARKILDALGERLALVPSPDAGVLFDVDLPEDIRT